MSHGHKHTKDVVNRLKRINGHVLGVVKMVENHKPCDEVLHQISAIKAAITKVGQVIMNDHFDECIVSKIDDEKLKEDLDLFKNAITKLNG